jgi:hypothetical protein
MCGRSQPSSRGTVDVLGHRHVREQPDLLDDVSDPPPQPGGVERSHAGAVDPDVTLGDVDQPVDHPHGGGLAGPEGPTSTQISPAGTVSDRELTAGSARRG